MKPTSASAATGGRLARILQHGITRALGRAMFWLTVIAATVMLLATCALVIAVNQAMTSLPNYEQIRATPAAQTIRYRSADGQIIYESGPAYGEWIEWKDIPQPMINAMLSIEDRRYWDHPGIDPVAIARVVNLAIRKDKGRLQGASTITQQAARTLFLDRSYEVKRKIREMILALAMEQKFSKQQILELYLNRVYLGGGAHGIDAASRTFFGHGAKRLNPGEAAVIAGTAKAPSEYSPTANPKMAVARAKTVLAKMMETRRIGPNDYRKYMEEAPIFKKEKAPQRDGTRYFIDWVADQIPNMQMGHARNVDVYTTIDLNMQRDAEAALDGQAGKMMQGAIVTIEQTGAVKAMVGGRSYTRSNYNRATQAVRQPGSAFKPFVYMTALENGYTPSSMVLDAPISINGWSPQNNSKRFSGMMTMSSAFAWSINTVAVRLGKDVGFERVAAMAQRFGITTPIQVTPSITLGTPEVRVLEMTRAYSIIANQGKDVLPYGINRIVGDGHTIYQLPKISEHQIVRPNVAARMTRLMTGTVNMGTGTAAAIGRPMAGKTGTTSAGKDGWFIGFSSGLTTAVWVGRDDAKPISGLQGGRTPARIFATYMRKAVAKLAIKPLVTIEPEPQTIAPVPQGMVETTPAAKPKAEPKRSSTTVPAETSAGEGQVTVRRGSAEPETAPAQTTNGKSRIIPMDQ